MNQIHFHADEIAWQSLRREEGPLRWKELLNKERGGSGEFIFGLAELEPGGLAPLLAPAGRNGFHHLRFGAVSPARIVELGAGSAMFFAGERPHSIESTGLELLRYLCTYACEKSGFLLDWRAAGESAAAQVDILNKGRTRWVVNEEFGPWIPTEPSKGFKVRIRYLFDQERGGFQEMMAGIFELDLGTHYTLHFHDHPELYYVLSGSGVIYAGDL